MRKMGKQVVMILMLTAMAMLAGCGAKEAGASEIVGTWKAAAIETAGISVDFEQYAQQLGQDADKVNMNIEVKEDNKFTMDMMGQKSDGTWAEKDGKYILTTGGTDQEVTIADGKLVFEEASMSIKITFEKK